MMAKPVASPYTKAMDALRLSKKEKARIVDGMMEQLQRGYEPAGIKTENMDGSGVKAPDERLYFENQ